MDLRLGYSYKIGNITFTKRDIYVAFLGILAGTLLGAFALAVLVPSAGSWIKLYGDEKKTLAQVKKGEINVPADIWMHHVESLKAKSENEYLSDMINLNNTAVLMNNRLQLGTYAANEEVRALGNKIAKAKEEENKELKALSDKYYPLKDQGTKPQ